VGESDDGERIARLEERVKVLEADAFSTKRMIYGAVAVVVALIWNKLAALIGMGPQ
jgi:hypothetical protein